jgi:DNA mismatch repair protein MutL
VEPTIAVLAPHVIDQIAAGEVIERPASVVKELVDNAIDAGAATVVIDVAGGGRTLVRVTDDGIGMSAAAAMLALERHATSKLREVDDLWGIASMGFRGEALPSIASVSRMTLTTRRAGDDAATRIVIEGGVLISVGDAGAAVGTTVEVADLLYNLPARLKFLKGEATEASHVTELVGKVAMAYPRLHVKLKHNGRTALDVPPDRDGLARAQALLGPRIAARLHPVIGEESGVRVTAYLGAPELAQATARGVQLFVGRRPVRDRSLLHALTMGYGELVPRGRYPLAVVLVDVPAGAVDVNVHPQKLEVRFSDTAAVAAAVRHLVQAGVQAAGWRDEGGGVGPVQMIASVAPPVLPFDGRATQLAERHVAQMQSRQVPLGFAPEVSASRSFVTSAAASAPAGAPSAAAGSPSGGASEAGAPRPASGAAREWARALRDQTRASRVDEPRESWDAERAAAAPSPTGSELAVAARSQPQPDMFADAAAEGSAERLSAQTLGRNSEQASEARRGFFSQLRYLGQLDLTYLVCEADGELVLIDQHAAHERVELARLRDRPRDGDGRVAVQNLLFAITFEATAPQLELVSRVGDVLSQVGFEVEPFGKTTLAVKAVPANLRHGDPAELLRTLLHQWAEAGAPSEAERLDALLGEIACHSVVRAGDRLTASEAENLLRSLDGVDLTLPAPHGRAVLLRLPLAEIGRRFGR